MKIQMALVGFSAIMLVAGCNKQPDQSTGSASTSAPGGQSTRPEPAASVPSAAVVKTCNVEKVDSQGFKPSPPTVKANSTVRLSGWIIDEHSGSVPGNVSLQLLGNGTPAHDAPITMWRDRPDVATAHKSDAYLKSGFSVDVSLKGLPTGDYSVVLVNTGPDTVSKCDVGRHLVIM